MSTPSSPEPLPTIASTFTSTPGSLPEGFSTPLLWGAFILGIMLLLMIDLGVFKKGKEKVLTFSQALFRCFAWVGVAALFDTGVYLYLGTPPAVEFLTAYLIELSLSVDNIFVFILIFTYFAVPQAVQHKVLFFGILGAIIMRGFFIIVGLQLINMFHFALYIFGAILIYSGYKLFFHKDEQVNPEANPVIRWFKRVVPLVPNYHDDKFFVRQGAKLFATPLLLVLVSIEVTDVIFAVDSVPAVFAISKDPFIVFTSNIFAILGLRSMYFLLAGAVQKLVYLRYGLACILIFVGIKMISADLFHLPTLLSLGVIAAILALSIVTSLLFPPAHTPESHVH